MVPTLKYGSADGALTCFADDEKLNSKMRIVGKSLNLAEHSVLDKRIYGPGDIGFNFFIFLKIILQFFFLGQIFFR
jgi:hypothetical protein